MMTPPNTPPADAMEAAPWCRDAWFVLTTFGDGHGTSIHRGWAAICNAYLAVHYHEPDAEQKAEVMARLTDWEQWENGHDGFPWFRNDGYEDGSVTIERVTVASESLDTFAAERVAEARRAAIEEYSTPTYEMIVEMIAELGSDDDRPAASLVYDVWKAGIRALAEQKQP